MMDTEESSCFFDGLDFAKDAMLKSVRAMCDARYIEDAERVASDFGKLIDVLGHLVGAGSLLETEIPRRRTLKQRRPWTISDITHTILDRHQKLPH